MTTATPFPADIDAVCERTDKIFTALCKGEAVLCVLHPVRLVVAGRLDTELVRLFNRLIDQIADDSMTVRRDTDRLALTYKLTNHFRAGESLTGAGRALKSITEMAAYPECGFERAFAVLPDLLPAKLRRGTEQ